MSGRAARDAAATTAIVIGVGAAFVLAYRLRLALCAALGAIVIGVALAPVVEAVARRGPSRRVAGLLVFGSLLVALGAAAVLLLPAATQQLTALLADLPGLVQQLHAQLHASSLVPSRWIAEWLRPLSRSAPVSEAAPVLERAADVLGRAVSGGYRLVLVLVMAATWSDLRLSGGRVLDRLDAARRASLCELLAQAEVKIGTYARGQLTVCAVSALIATIAYVALGLPYALLLALVTGAAEILPVAGPLVAGVAVGLVALAAAPDRLPWVLGVLVVNHALQSYLVMPRVMDRAVGVSPLTVLLSVSVFGGLLGLAGAALAVPIAAILQLLYDRFVAPGARRPWRLRAA